MEKVMDLKMDQPNKWSKSCLVLRETKRRERNWKSRRDLKWIIYGVRFLRAWFILQKIIY